MSNSTYCQDQYEKPYWMDQLDRLRKSIKELEKERDGAGRKMLDRVCEWLDSNAARYVVTRYIHGMEMECLDASLTADLRKAMEEDK